MTIKTIRKALGLALRLIPALIKTSLQYRAFRKQFIQSAAEAGMPPALAFPLAHDMRPGLLVRGLKRKEAGNQSWDRD